MPLQSTSGAASYDAFGGGAAAKVNYIEDFFQSYLRTGTGASATVTTGLDGSTKETLVWTKSRSAATNHKLTDNVRGATKALSSNTTVAEATDSQGLTAFSATGYTLGTNTDYNNSGATYVDWQWIAQPKFFDIVTYTGNGSSGRTLSHSLESQPGFILIKRTDGTDPWLAFARLNGTDYSSLRLNSTAAGSSYTQSNIASSTVINVGYINSNIYSCNIISETYVAYIFAHDAGGFGLTGTDNVISCGSFTASGSGAYSGSASINLGWEPQWVLMKEANNTLGTQDWTIVDNMRGWPSSSDTNPYGYANKLSANLSNAATNVGDCGWPTSTGFNVGQVTGGATYIYIAIRRGPMKVPTSGTSVFSPITRTGTGAAATISGIGFAPDLVYPMCRNDIANKGGWVDKLRGASRNLTTNLTDAESSNTQGVTAFGNTSISVGTSSFFNSALNYVNYFFVRAPSFFDEVCYTGTGSATTVTHNLGVAPELMIVKSRDGVRPWDVYVAALGNGNELRLNATDAVGSSSAWNSTTPTSSVFSLGSGSIVNAAGENYVNYLFASCPGVSKVTNFTGTGSLQTINCGFTSGARFALIKRTDAAGDWYVWDSARGITSSTDPYLLLNSTAAEVTSTNWVDTTSTGFQVTAAGGNNVNINGASYIALAIA